MRRIAHQIEACGLLGVVACECDAPHTASCVNHVQLAECMLFSIDRHGALATNVQYAKLAACIEEFFCDCRGRSQLDRRVEGNHAANDDAIQIEHVQSQLP